jgi:SNF2 family DNA or RNA helicase
MAIRKFGQLDFDESLDTWQFTVEPHVAIRLKNLFQQIPKWSTNPIPLKNKPDIPIDIAWLLDRYPLNLTEKAEKILSERRTKRLKDLASLEEILLPNREAAQTGMKKPARAYQSVFADIMEVEKSILLADMVGIGKTVSALTLAARGHLPVLVIVPKHLKKQWVEKSKEFTYLSAHIIKKTKAYDLPPADIYIVTYNMLVGWVDLVQTGFFKYVVLDEVQDIRKGTETQKGQAAKKACSNAEYIAALSASPIYNKLDELHNIFDIIKPGRLGTYAEFSREWYTEAHKDPKALGTYLRENFMMLRRTREEVGRELPKENVFIQQVEFDDDKYGEFEDRLKVLATKITTQHFATREEIFEKGRLMGELDIMVRQATGIGKAKGVADYARMFLENDTPIILVG